MANAGGDALSGAEARSAHACRKHAVYWTAQLDVAFDV